MITKQGVILAETVVEWCEVEFGFVATNAVKNACAKPLALFYIEMVYLYDERVTCAEGFNPRMQFPAFLAHDFCIAHH